MKIRTRQIRINKEMEGRTAESILAREFGMAGARISRLKRSNSGVCLNGIRAYTTARVHAGDLLSAEIGDDPPRPTAEPVAMPLDIVYEDEDLLILNKPAGLAVQPTRDPNEISLEHGLAAYLQNGDVAHPVSMAAKTVKTTAPHQRPEFILRIPRTPF